VRSALLRDNIEKAGVPAVTAAWAHEVGSARLLLAVAIKQRYPGHAKQAGHIATMCHVGAYCGRYTIVVHDDIDVSSLEEVIWAMLTRSDPATSIDIIRNAWSTISSMIRSVVRGMHTSPLVGNGPVRHSETVPKLLIFLASV
jgi:UbiD family decarboxylase